MAVDKPVSHSVPCPTLRRHVAKFRSLDPNDTRGEVPVSFRPIRPDDEQRLQDFFHSHTEETVYLRYGMVVRELTHERALELVDLDGHNELALIGVVPGPVGDRIIAVGRYAADPETRLAEVAFVVHEAFRGLGIATHLLYCLSALIYEEGFVGVKAQVLSCNHPMLNAMDEALGPADWCSDCAGERTLRWYFPV